MKVTQNGMGSTVCLVLQKGLLRTPLLGAGLPSLLSGPWKPLRPHCKGGPRYSPAHCDRVPGGTLAATE